MFLPTGTANSVHSTPCRHEPSVFTTWVICKGNEDALFSNSCSGSLKSAPPPRHLPAGSRAIHQEWEPLMWLPHRPLFYGILALFIFLFSLTVRNLGRSQRDFSTALGDPSPNRFSLICKLELKVFQYLWSGEFFVFEGAGALTKQPYRLWAFWLVIANQKQVGEGSGYPKRIQHLGSHPHHSSLLEAAHP